MNGKYRKSISKRSFSVVGSTALLAAVWLSFAAATGAAQPLVPYSAEYKVKISVLSGVLNTELRTTEAGYSARHVIKPTGMARMFARGSINESSDFSLSHDSLLPNRYSSADTLSKDKTQADVTFDWSTSEMAGTVNGEEVRSTLEDFVHDRVSIQYELMRDLLNGGPGEQYILFDIDELKTLNVRTIGTKSVKVPAGRFDAVGVQHQAENSSRVTTLWCVEELGYLPVMIEQHRKGKLRLRASLKNYEPAAT